MIPRMKRTGAVTAFAGLVAAALLSCVPVGGEKYSIQLPEHHAKLANGMRVIVLPDPSTPLVEVDVRWEVGANEDPEGKSGIAHMVEHMMFQQRPAGLDKPELFKAIRQIAIFFNAFTNWDTTHYMDMVRKEDLESILAIESARMYLGCETIDVSQFEREREVVRNEYRQNYGTPEAQAYWKILEAAYPVGHPYRRLIIGTDDQLSAATFEDVCQFMKDYYTPSRATLIIAGNITIDEASPLIAKYFGAIPFRDAKPRASTPPINLKRQTFTHELDIPETQVSVIWAMPPQYAEEGTGAYFAASILTGRVNREGDEYEFATNVEPGILGGAHAPIFVVTVSVRSPGDVDKALDAIFRAAKGAYRNIAEELDDESFKEVVASNKAGLVMQFENLPARTVQFGDWAQFQPDGGYFGGELARMDRLDFGRMRSIAKRIFDPSKAVVVIVKAKQGAARTGKKGSLKFGGATSDKRDDSILDPSEAKRPLPAPSGDLNMAAVKRFTMGNGMNVVLLPTKATMPIMAVNLVFRAGSVHESPSQAGLAQVAGRMLNPPFVDMGTGGNAASANVLGRVGAETDVSVGSDTTVFSVRGLSIYEEPIIKGLERWIKAGDYNQEGIERYRKFLGFAMKRRSYVADLTFRREMATAVYGADHPYALTGEPTVKSLGNVGRDAAMDFKSNHYRSKNATLIVAGNFDVGRVESIIRDNFGDWSGGTLDKPVSAAPAPRTGPIYLGVGNEELASVSVRISYPAPAGLDGQHAARLILAEMLSSRMGAIREKLGSSYGVGAGLMSRLGPGSYIMAGAIDAERIGPSLVAMREGVQSLRAGVDFDAEFAKARRAVLKELLTSSGTSGELASQLLYIATYGLADTFFEKLIHKVAAASPTQVKELIAAELKPELEVVGILGPKATVEKAYAEAGLKLTKWID